VDEESSLGKTGRVDDESNVGDAGIDVDRVTPERAAVPEVGRRRRRRRKRRRRRRRAAPELGRRRGRRHGRYLDVVVAAAGALDVQLEVEDGEADRLSRLDAHPPPALGVHVVLVRIVGTRHVAAAVEFDGRRFTGGGRRQRRTSAVDRRNCTAAHGQSLYAGIY